MAEMTDQGVKGIENLLSRKLLQDIKSNTNLCDTERAFWLNLVTVYGITRLVQITRATKINKYITPPLPPATLHHPDNFLQIAITRNQIIEYT